MVYVGERERYCYIKFIVIVVSVLSDADMIFYCDTLLALLFVYYFSC